MLARFPFECDSVKLKTYCDVAASICLVLTVQTTKIKLEALGLEYVFLLIWLHSIKIIIMRKRALPRRPSSVPGIFRREGTKECRQCTAAPISVGQKEIGGKKKKATSCKPIWNLYFHPVKSTAQSPIVGVTDYIGRQPSNLFSL